MAERYQRSYSYPRFNTADGQLGADQYADAGIGRRGIQRWWIASPQVHGGLVATSDTRDIQGKTLVTMAGDLLYFHEFVDDQDGRVTRQATTKEDLDQRRTTPGSPPPTREGVIGGR